MKIGIKENYENIQGKDSLSSAKYAKLEERNKELTEENLRLRRIIAHIMKTCPIFPEGGDE